MKIISINTNEHKDLKSRADSILTSLNNKTTNNLRFATFTSLGFSYAQNDIGFHDMIVEFLATKGESEYYLVTLDHQNNVENQYPFFCIINKDIQHDIDDTLYFEVYDGVPIGQIVQGFLLFSLSQDWFFIDMKDLGVTFMCVLSKNDLVNIFNIFDIDNQSFSTKEEINEISKYDIIGSWLKSNGIIYFEDFVNG